MKKYPWDSSFGVVPKHAKKDAQKCEDGNKKIINKSSVVR